LELWAKAEQACIANTRIWFQGSVGFCVVKLGFVGFGKEEPSLAFDEVEFSDAFQRNRIWEVDKIKGNTVTPIG